MTEWWTYRPADFLMFAPQTYWRLFELLNGGAWPLQWIGAAAGVAWVIWVWRRRLGVRGSGTGGTALQVAGLALAAAYAFVAWAYLLELYAPVNLAAPVYAGGFAVQAVGLVALGLCRGLRLTANPVRRVVGSVMVVAACAGYPLLTAAFGRPWSQAEAIGLAPDPTAWATLGVLLLARTAHRVTSTLLRGLWIVPLLWCLVSVVTLQTMGEVQWVVVLAGAVVAGIAALLPVRRSPVLSANAARQRARS